jgi:hypothetical protein
MLPDAYDVSRFINRSVKVSILGYQMVCAPFTTLAAFHTGETERELHYESPEAEGRPLRGGYIQSGLLVPNTAKLGVSFVATLSASFNAYCIPVGRRTRTLLPPECHSEIVKLLLGKRSMNIEGKINSYFIP